jgi:hypothetical protein
MECLPDPQCQCCACRGVYCFMPHEGHDHRTNSLYARAAIERSSPLLMALDRMQDMLMRVEWVRQASGKKYACAFCGGVSERDGGTGHADDCEWQHVTSADFVAIAKAEGR